MPWAIHASDDRCPVGKPWAVVNEQTNRLAGCHPNRKSAIQQQRALYANVPESNKSTSGGSSDPNTDKSSKAVAHYRQGTEERHCGICTMFREPHSCTAVAGSIAPNGVCDYFKERSGKSMDVTQAAEQVAAQASGTDSDSKTKALHKAALRVAAIRKDAFARQFTGLSSDDLNDTYSDALVPSCPQCGSKCSKCMGDMGMA